MEITNELTILKSILLYKDEILNDIDKLEYYHFQNSVFQAVFYIIKKFIKTYNRFPNYSEFLLWLEEKKDKFDFAENELIEKVSLEKIKEVARYLQEDSNEKIEKKELKKYINKIIKGYILRKNLENIKDCFKNVDNAEKVFEKILDELNSIQVDFEIGRKGLNWFLELERPIREGILPVGVPYLDVNFDGGLAKREIVLLAASTGTGKTTFLTSMLTNYLKQPELTNELFVYITLEQPEEQIMGKIVSILLEVNYSLFKSKKPSEVIYKLIGHNKEIMDFIKDRLDRVIIKYFLANTSIFEIVKYIKKLRQQFKHSRIIVFIDYVNEISFPRKERWEALESIMTEIDKLANELEISFWTAIQSHEKKRKKDSLVFDINDLYGSKIGVSKKITFGIGLKKDKEMGKIYLSFFKNRILGKIDTWAEVSFDRHTSKLIITSPDNLLDLDTIEVPTLNEIDIIPKKEKEENLQDKQKENIKIKSDEKYELIDDFI